MHLPHGGLYRRAGAVNYDDSALVDDGSCLFGCMDPAADNYDENANVGEECTYPMEFNDAEAINYDDTALVDDGSRLFLGCMDLDADNYDPNANVRRALRLPG